MPQADRFSCRRHRGRMQSSWYSSCSSCCLDAGASFACAFFPSALPATVTSDGPSPADVGVGVGMAEAELAPVDDACAPSTPPKPRRPTYTSFIARNSWRQVSDGRWLRGGESASPSAGGSTADQTGTTCSVDPRASEATETGGLSEELPSGDRFVRCTTARSEPKPERPGWSWLNALEAWIEASDATEAASRRLAFDEPRDASDGTQTNRTSGRTRSFPRRATSFPRSVASSLARSLALALPRAARARTPWSR